jgi:putative ABC transport system ATP-binding protein
VQERSAAYPLLSAAARAVRLHSSFMITLRHVDRVYPLKGGPYYALRNINLEVKEGDFLSIMGPSGSGKSTLLHLMGLHDAGWDGEYELLGQPVHQLDKKKRFDLQKKNIGFVFQSYHLLDDLTVYENLEVPLSYRDMPKRERESVVCDTLDRFHMVAKKDLYPSQLSGGQQQLVGVARALIAKPVLLLADEPTGNLHSDQGREIMELFKKLNRDEGVTIVQVTHSNENAGYGSRVVRLADGMLVNG